MEWYSLMNGRKTYLQALIFHIPSSLLQHFPLVLRPYTKSDFSLACVGVFLLRLQICRSCVSLLRQILIVSKRLLGFSLRFFQKHEFVQKLPNLYKPQNYEQHSSKHISYRLLLYDHGMVLIGICLNQVCFSVYDAYGFLGEKQYSTTVAVYNLLFCRIACRCSRKHCLFIYTVFFRQYAQGSQFVGLLVSVFRPPRVNEIRGTYLRSTKIDPKHPNLGLYRF